MPRNERLTFNIQARDNASPVIDDIKQRLSQLNEQVGLEIDLDVRGAVADFDRLTTEAAQLDRLIRDFRIALDTTQAELSLDRLESRLSSGLSGEVDLDTSSAERRISRLGSRLERELREAVRVATSVTVDSPSSTGFAIGRGPSRVRGAGLFGRTLTDEDIAAIESQFGPSGLQPGQNLPTAGLVPPGVGAGAANIGRNTLALIGAYLGVQGLDIGREALVGGGRATGLSPLRTQDARETFRLALRDAGISPEAGAREVSELLQIPGIDEALALRLANQGTRVADSFSQLSEVLTGIRGSLIQAGTEEVTGESLLQQFRDALEEGQFENLAGTTTIPFEVISSDELRDAVSQLRPELGPEPDPAVFPQEFREAGFQSLVDFFTTDPRGRLALQQGTAGPEDILSIPGDTARDLAANLATFNENFLQFLRSDPLVGPPVPRVEGPTDLQQRQIIDQASAGLDILRQQTELNAIFATERQADIVSDALQAVGLNELAEQAREDIVAFRSSSIEAGSFVIEALERQREALDQFADSIGEVTARVNQAVEPLPQPRVALPGQNILDPGVDPDEVIRNRAFRAPTPRRTPAEDLFTDAEFNVLFNRQETNRLRQPAPPPSISPGFVQSFRGAFSNEVLDPFGAASFRELLTGGGIGGLAGGIVGGVGASFVQQGFDRIAEGLFDGGTKLLKAILDQGQEPREPSGLEQAGLLAGDLVFGTSPVSELPTEETTPDPTPETPGSGSVTIPNYGNIFFSTGTQEETIEEPVVETPSFDVDPLSLVPSATPEEPLPEPVEEPPDQVLTGRGEPTQPPGVSFVDELNETGDFAPVVEEPETSERPESVTIPNFGNIFIPTEEFEESQESRPAGRPTVPQPDPFQDDPFNRGQQAPVTVNNENTYNIFVDATVDDTPESTAQR